MATHRRPNPARNGQGPAFTLSRARALRYTSPTEGSKAQRLTHPSPINDTGAPGRVTFRPADPRPMTRVIA